ncbi:hypothetical protein D8674_003074 [Pyrus ussuriensis x Pyrus communis]|uniref:Uncharacterized protein n=1 Tax=Pyrus ussuriensis x Pyrus communis TaxID=2448454 RepID=A0A5N5FG26_9ROSA|nr:hypothetical protein D8674_003074 [Pyrus ussuriensis x Pyrus communis]
MAAALLNCPTGRLHLVGFFCIILLFTSVAGPAGALNENYRCLGPCNKFPGSGCNAACKFWHFNKAVWIVFGKNKDPLCCCS